MVTAYTGMRQSELLGLRWCDVDFEAGCSTCGTSCLVRKQGEAREAHAAEDGAGERWIELAPALSRELARHSLASVLEADDFVFTTETGKPLYYRNVSRARTRQGSRPGWAQPGGSPAALVPRSASHGDHAPDPVGRRPGAGLSLRRSLEGLHDARPVRGRVRETKGERLW